MCDRWAAAVLLAAVLAGAPALAQDVGTLRARLTRLEPVWRAAARAADRADSAGTYGPLDTIRVGALTVFAAPRLAAMARDAATRAWPMLDSLYGAEKTRLGGSRWYVLPATPGLPGRGFNTNRGVFAVPVPSEGTADQILTDILIQASYVYGQEDWLGTFYGYEPHPERVLADAYVELVTAPARAARGCLLGDIHECAVAFWLEPTLDPVLQWYDAADRRRNVSELGWRWGPRDQTLKDACAAGSDPACIELLRSLPEWALPQPFSSVSRVSLLRTALRLGGKGAFSRWLADRQRLVSLNVRLSRAAVSDRDSILAAWPREVSRPIAARLSHAAGLPTDSLLATWRAEVLAARPKTVTIPDRAAWVAVCWGTLLALVALRSSRWR